MLPGAPISSRRSFTLVEMLVAMVVLVLVMGIIFNIFGSASKLTDSVERDGDSANEARQVLDRIATDVSGMIIRPDVDELFYKPATTGSDKMFFYTLQSGYYNILTSNKITPNDITPVSLVGYRISTNVPPVLQRLVQGITWDGYDSSVSSGSINYGMSFLDITYTPPTINNGQVVPGTRVLSDSTSTIAGRFGSKSCPRKNGSVGTFNNNYDDGVSSYYDAVGSQVFRMEICFQQLNGTFTTNCPSPIPPGTMTNTTAMIVAIAVLDSKSRKLMTTQAQWTSLINALPKATPNNVSAIPPVLMDSQWNTALQTPISGVPPLAQSHVKVYQRYYYLNAPKYQ